LGTTGSPVRPSIAQIGGGQELPGHVPADALVERHEERQVGVALHVVDEERHAALDEELLEDHVPHRHRQRAVGAGLRG
jgi:hypothetical protein